MCQGFVNILGLQWKVTEQELFLKTTKTFKGTKMWGWFRQSQ